MAFWAKIVSGYLHLWCNTDQKQWRSDSKRVGLKAYAAELASSSWGKGVRFCLFTLGAQGLVCRSLLPTFLIEVLLLPTSLVHSPVVLHACSTQMADVLTMADTLQAKAADHNSGHIAELFKFAANSSSGVPFLKLANFNQTQT